MTGFSRQRNLRFDAELAAQMLRLSCAPGAGGGDSEGDALAVAFGGTVLEAFAGAPAET